MSTLDTSIDFGIKGDRSFRCEQISSLLGIEPTHGFNPNEPYLGKVKVGDAIVSIERNRPSSFGVWRFSTENKVEGNSIEDHARFLIGVLLPVKDAIAELLRSSAHDVYISIWYVGPPVGFDITSEAMSQLTAFCSRITVRVFDSPEETDDE